jgi:predicted transcriptional regulator
MSDQNNPDQIDIQLSEEVAQGTYSNLAVITHSSSEFVIDFVRIMPGLPKADVKSRVILTPEHAKRLMHALQDNINKFEAMNGPIKNMDGGNEPQGPIIPMNFGPTGQA